MSLIFPMAESTKCENSTRIQIEEIIYIRDCDRNKYPILVKFDKTYHTIDKLVQNYNEFESKGITPINDPIVSDIETINFQGQSLIDYAKENNIPQVSLYSTHYNLEHETRLYFMNEYKDYINNKYNK